ncbi:MAG: hypothetical protein R3F20_17990 [Planctomycetota bacterium]
MRMLVALVTFTLGGIAIALGRPGEDVDRLSPWSEDLSSGEVGAGPERTRVRETRRLVPLAPRRRAPVIGSDRTASPPMRIFEVLATDPHGRPVTDCDLVLDTRTNDVPLRRVRFLEYTRYYVPTGPVVGRICAEGFLDQPVRSDKRLVHVRLVRAPTLTVWSVGLGPRLHSSERLHLRALDANGDECWRSDDLTWSEDLLAFHRFAGSFTIELVLESRQRFREVLHRIPYRGNGGTEDVLGLDWGPAEDEVLAAARQRFHEQEIADAIGPPEVGMLHCGPIEEDLYGDEEPEEEPEEEEPEPEELVEDPILECDLFETAIGGADR